MMTIPPDSPITEDQWAAYGRYAPGVYAAITPLTVAFAIARKFKDHTALLKMTYMLLVAHLGPKGAQQCLAMMGRPSFTKKEQDTTLLACFISSGLSQQQFARQAATYNQGSPLLPYGTGCTDSEAMLNAIKRAKKRHPEFYADFKRFNATLPPGLLRPPLRSS
jgi:hypothetical protein